MEARISLLRAFYGFLDTRDWVLTGCYRCPLLVARCSMVDGRWSMVDGRWSMVDGRWSMVDGRWSTGCADAGERVGDFVQGPTK